MEHLQKKHEWLRAEPRHRKRLEKRNGTRFTEFDRIPGWYSILNSPIDTMHLFHLGITPWLTKSVIVLSGMLGQRHRRQPEEETPAARFDAALKRLYLPSHCSRLPPEVSSPAIFISLVTTLFQQIKKMGSRVKAEQWQHIAPVIPILFFEAWRVGDIIPEGDIPRGPKNTKTFKHQLRNSKLLLRQRRKVHDNRNDEALPYPILDDCAASRDPRHYLLNFIRYAIFCRAVLCHNNTREDTSFGMQLIQRAWVSLSNMNVYLSPSFHWSLHLEPFILKYGSIYGTWSYPFERANQQLINTNNNGHGLGTLETTMARGWLKKTECIRIVSFLFFEFLF